MVIFIKHRLAVRHGNEEEQNIHHSILHSWLCLCKGEPQCKKYPLKLTARFVIVFIDLASLIERGNRESREREQRKVAEGEQECMGRD